MVKINRIYTRTGDDGTTGLVGGTRIDKDSPRMNAVGDIDETNAAIGWARTLALEVGNTLIASQLEEVQQELFDIGAEVATPPGVEWQGLTLVSEESSTRLEHWIDELLKGIPELRSFVLPGGTQLLAALHLARTITRRAERSLLALSRQEYVSKNVIVYCNRLSDLFFAMARHEALRAGKEEFLWVPKGKRKA